MTGMPADGPLLAVSGLSVGYGRGRGPRHIAVDGVSFEVGAGQTVGLVGESGSGKSSIARAIVGLAPVTSGRISLGGTVIADAAGRRAPAPQRDIQMVFQDPYSSLDPTKTIGYSVAEPLRHYSSLAKAEIDRAVGEMLEQVGIPAGAAGRYPAQYSGGQRQRVAIARALILRPRLVICDEALSALDLSVQAQIINLLADYQDSHGVSYLFISHDLGVVRMLCDQVVVLYRGRTVERGDAETVYHAPQHPYARGLVAAVPEIDPASQEAAQRRRNVFRKPASRPRPLGDRCEFAHRCAFAAAECEDSRPAPRPAPSGAVATCHRLAEVAAAVDGALSGLPQPERQR